MERAALVQRRLSRGRFWPRYARLGCGPVRLEA